MSDQGVRKAAEKFRDSMKDLGLGVSIKPGDGPWVKVTDPPETEQPKGEPMSVQTAERPSEERQLSFTFNVGGHTPDLAKVGFSGKAELERELRKGEELVLNVIDANGELVVSAHGVVTAIAFVDKETEDGTVTTREHKIKLV